MLSAALVFLILASSVVFLMNQRGYFLLFLFYCFSGLADIAPFLPRVFDVVLFSNLITLQFTLFGILVTIQHWPKCREALKSAGAVATFFGILFGASLLVNALANMYGSATFFSLLFYLNLAISLFVGVTLFDSQESLLAVGLTLAAAVFVNVVPVIYQLATGRTWMSFYYQRVSTMWDLTERLEQADLSLLRVRGWFYGHASFAASLMLAVPFLVFMRSESISSEKRRFVFLLAAILGLMTLYMTFMRGAWLEVAVVALITLLFGVKQRVKAGIAVMMLVLLVMLLPQTLTRFQGELVPQYQGAEDISTGRLLLWAKLVDYVPSSLLIGNGVGSYEGIARSALDGEYVPPHNDYYWLLLECGWIAPFLYLLFLGTLAWRAIQIGRHSASSTINRLGIMTGGYIIAQVLHGFVANLFTPQAKFLPVLLLGIVFTNSAKQAESRKAP